MTYRDDREALRARAEQAERERDEAERELERLRAQETARKKERDDARRELERLRGKAGMPGPPVAARKRGPSLISLMIGTAIVGILAATVVPMFVAPRPPQAVGSTAAAAASSEPPSSAKPVPVSEPTSSAAPSGNLPENVERRGRVTRVAGPTPLMIETTCSVRVLGLPGSLYNCRVVVECDGRTLYGEELAGYNACVVENGVFAGATDSVGTGSEGDPMLSLDLPGNRVVVSDDPASGPWSVEVTLD